MYDTMYKRTHDHREPVPETSYCIAHIEGADWPYAVYESTELECAELVVLVKLEELFENSKPTEKKPLFVIFYMNYSPTVTTAKKLNSFADEYKYMTLTIIAAGEELSAIKEPCKKRNFSDEDDWKALRYILFRHVSILVAVICSYQLTSQYCLIVPAKQTNFTKIFHQGIWRFLAYTYSYVQ